MSILWNPPHPCITLAFGCAFACLALASARRSLLLAVLAASTLQALVQAGPHPAHWIAAPWPLLGMRLAVDASLSLGSLANNALLAAMLWLATQALRRHAARCALAYQHDFARLVARSDRRA